MKNPKLDLDRNIKDDGLLVSYIAWVFKVTPGSTRNDMTLVSTAMLAIGLPIVLATLILGPSGEVLGKRLEPLDSKYPPVPLVKVALMATSAMGWVFITFGPIGYLLGLACPEERVEDE